MAINTEVYFRIIVAIILNYDPEAPPYEDGDHMKLKRLEMAIDYKQKKVLMLRYLISFENIWFIILNFTVCGSPKHPTTARFVMITLVYERK